MKNQDSSEQSTGGGRRENLRPFEPGTNSVTGTVHRRGPNRMPRVISTTIRHALAERNAKGLKDLKRRIQKILATGSNDEVIKLLPFLRDSLEGRPSPTAEEVRQPLRSVFILESTGKEVGGGLPTSTLDSFEVAGERMETIDPQDIG